MEEVQTMALSEKKKASNEKWDAKNLKRMSLALGVDEYERLRAYLDQTGESMNGFIRRAIAEKLDRDTGK